ncbi:hypothetical protein FBY04_1358 [Pseudomonas sp. SJZ080]|nr:hypothetical protein FBY04_1358 [Pseudomonas sp. SJZ080]
MQVPLKTFADAEGLFASKPVPTGICVRRKSPVGAGLLAKGVAQAAHIQGIYTLRMTVAH